MKENDLAFIFSIFGIFALLPQNYDELGNLPDLSVYVNPQSFPFGNLTGVPNVQLEHGLVLWLPFDGVNKDKSGYVNPVTSYGSPVYGSGWFERGLVFDGVNDYVDCGNSLVLDLSGNYSFAFWINGTTSLYSNAGGILARSEVAGNSFFVNVQARATYFNVRLERVAVVIDSDYKLYANNYYFVVMTFNGSYLNFYFNGIFSQGFSSSSLALVTVPLNVGRRAYSPYETYLNATLDDVRVFNRCLSAVEIMSLFNLPN